jgi:YVTN family beta-propeller protein
MTVEYGFFMAASRDGSTLYLEDTSHCGLVALDTADFSQKAAGSSFCDAEDAAILSPDGSRLYVNALYGAIDVFDAATLEMSARIAMPWAGGDMGSPMAFSRDGHELVVGDAANGTIAFVDAAHGVLETTSTGCIGASGLAFSADERLIYVLCIPSFDGAVLDARTHALLRTFPAGSYPSSYGDFAGDPPVPLYVADGAESGDVVALDPLTQMRGMPSRVGRSPQGVVASKDARWLYVTNGGDDTVSVVDADTRSEVATIAVGAHPTGLALSPDDSRLYVANTDGDSISVIDTRARTVVSTVPVDADSKPKTLAISADGGKLYVALSNWVWIAVYDTAAGALSAPIYCPSGISGIAMAPDGTTAYAAASLSSQVYKIDVATDTVVDTWDVGIDVDGFPHPVAVSPDGGRIYVGRGSSASPPQNGAYLIAVDTADGSELAWSTLAGPPGSLAVEPEGRFVYAAIPDADSVQVVDTTTGETVRTIGGFHAPTAIAPPVEPILDRLFGSGFD